MKNRATAGDVAEIKSILDSLIRLHGPRLSGTRACMDAARDLHLAFSRVCHRALLQPFSMHPDSFWAIPSQLAASFTLAGLLSFMNMPLPVTALVLLAGLVYGVVQFIFLGRFFDPLFPRREGLNLAGILEPSGRVQQQLLICAHHDSARRCRFLEKFQVLYPFRMVPAMLIYALTTLSFLLLPLSGRADLLYKAVPYLFLGGWVFILPFFFFYRRQGTVGAGDNLLASVLLIKTAEKVRESVEKLETTRLILVSHDGEEVGMRGAHAFVRENRDLLREAPTTVLCIDSLHGYADLTLLSSDRNGTVRLSAELNRKLSALWLKEGHGVQIRSLPLGGGGTDAAVYARAGLPTASLIGISTDFVRRGLVYHTQLDDVAHLDDRIIAASLDMLLETIRVLDQGGLDAGA